MNELPPPKNRTVDPNWVNVSSKAEVITPLIATEYLSRNINNRPLTKNQVKFYARQMSEGKWRINGEAICFDKDGNLINGQHRLSAVVEAGVPIASIVARGIDKEAFATYDSGMNRKISDVFALKSIPNATSVSSIVNKYVMLKKSGASVTSNMNGMINAKWGASSRLTKQEVLEEYFSDPDLFQDIQRFAVSCYTRLRILLVGVIGSYVAYLVRDRHHDMAKVCEFFTMLTTESSFDNTMIAALRSRLIKNQMTNPNMRMNSTYVQQLIIKTWNAFIKGRSIKFLKWDESVEGRLKFE